MLLTTRFVSRRSGGRAGGKKVVLFLEVTRVSRRVVRRRITVGGRAIPFSRYNFGVKEVGPRITEKTDTDHQTP